ncbi:MAG: hypothetical protein ACK45Y_15320 [Betaproteobacteria bacterium]
MAVFTLHEVHLVMSIAFIGLPAIRARSSLVFGCISLSAVLSACGGGGGSGSEGSSPVPVVKRVVDFSSSPVCTGADADYTVGTAPPDTISAMASAPAPFQGQGWRLSGTNRSDDLFIYTKCRLTGLKPQQSYRVDFAADFLTSAPSGCAGVGGAPGEGVTVHAGATAQEPMTLLDGNWYFRVNLDRGNQTVGGSQSQALGHIGNAVSTCIQRQFAAKTLGPPAVLQTQADAQGGIWLHVGIDSGFESYSEVYLRSVSVTFTPL